MQLWNFDRIWNTSASVLVFWLSLGLFINLTLNLRQITLSSCPTEKLLHNNLQGPQCQNCLHLKANLGELLIKNPEKSTIDSPISITQRPQPVNKYFIFIFHMYISIYPLYIIYPIYLYLFRIFYISTKNYKFVFKLMINLSM